MLPQSAAISRPAGNPAGLEAWVTAMWDVNDRYGPNGLYTVQRERDAQLKQQEAAAEAAARRQAADAQQELNKSLFGEKTATNIGSTRSWWSW